MPIIIADTNIADIWWADMSTDIADTDLYYVSQVQCSLFIYSFNIFIFHQRHSQKKNWGLDLGACISVGIFFSISRLL